MGNKHEREQRRFDRLRSYWLIRYSKIGDRQNPDGTVTNVRNISEGGILFTAYEPLPVSSIVRIFINLPNRDQPLETYAKVLHCVKTGEEDVYHIGISFLDIPESDRKDIAGQIQKAAQDPRGKKLIQKHHWWQFWKKRKKIIRPVPGTKNVFFRSDDATGKNPT